MTITLVTSFVASIIGIYIYILIISYFDRPNAIAAQRWNHINRLRSGGVVSVNVHQWNDQDAITVCAEWTGWKDRRYQASTIDIALAQALNDMERYDR